MPYKSKAQMAMMHAKMPKMAAKWDAEMKAHGMKFPTGKNAKKAPAKKAVLGKTAKKAPARKVVKRNAKGR